ncbi:hypothetical protein CICLE_v10023288mg [Citrus x clementina]|uniref:Uncharacterized protein n=1 Tax=Citrus clementina TaxID=85681 RepID=V4T551_CITCL|nr:hypothetical protein CICLE_v10023288mg [Citrus x clementina]
MVKELGFEQNQITVHCDSQSAICLSKNQIHHEKTKHIDIKLHFVRFEISKEAHALRKSKASLQSHNRSLLPSWTIATTNVSSDITLCAWSGIGCNAAGRVVYINFTNTGLSGTLHDFSFSSFPHLTYLDLSFNELFGNLNNLVKLFLLDNSLSSSIPPNIGNLRSLLELDLSINQLSGSIPPSVGNLKSLAVLELNANQLNGSIPPSMGNLSSLIRLYLYDNSLYGSIPPNVGNLKSLAVLKLYANQLNGCIPRSFGFLPPPIGNLTNLRELFLFDNHLFGFIPREMGNLRPLVNLIMFQNQFTGFLPPPIGNLTDLQILDLMDNHLSDSITPSLGNICRGTIPESLRNCISLIRVRLNANNLTGNVLEALGLYHFLTFIDLSRNNFYGEISYNWGKCPKLGTLNVLMNNITRIIPLEEIPKELGKLNSLTKLILRGNQLTRHLPTEIGSNIVL